MISRATVWLIMGEGDENLDNLYAKRQQTRIEPPKCHVPCLSHLNAPRNVIATSVNTNCPR